MSAKQSGTLSSQYQTNYPVGGKTLSSSIQKPAPKAVPKNNIYNPSVPSVSSSQHSTSGSTTSYQPSKSKQEQENEILLKILSDELAALKKVLEEERSQRTEYEKRLGITPSAPTSFSSSSSSSSTSSSKSTTATAGSLLGDLEDLFGAITVTSTPPSHTSPVLQAYNSVPSPTFGSHGNGDNFNPSFGGGAANDVSHGFDDNFDFSQHASSSPASFSPATQHHQPQSSDSTELAMQLQSLKFEKDQLTSALANAIQAQQFLMHENNTLKAEVEQLRKRVADTEKTAPNSFNFDFS